MGKNSASHTVKLDAVKGILQKKIITTADFVENGFSASLLYHYKKLGALEKIGRGLYIPKGHPPQISIEWEDLVFCALEIPSAVVTGTSALALYNLTEEIPRFHWISVPHATSLKKRASVKIIRSRNHSVGISSIDIGDVSISIYCVERVILESFKFLSLETAIKALRSAFSSTKVDIDMNKLETLSRKLRINITPYIEMATTI